MIIYTPLDLEQVLSGMDKERTFQEIEYKGVLMQVEFINLKQFKIERILSSDNQLFLNDEFQPGTIIEQQIK